VASSSESKNDGSRPAIWVGSSLMSSKGADSSGWDLRDAPGAAGATTSGPAASGWGPAWACDWACEGEGEGDDRCDVTAASGPEAGSSVAAGVRARAAVSATVGRCGLDGDEACGSRTEKELEGRRTAIPPAPGLAEPGTPLRSRLPFSTSSCSSTVWLSGVSLSNLTPIPGGTLVRFGSNSRIQTTVPSPDISAVPLWNWKSNFSRVPTPSGSRVRMKMPPRLTSTAYRSMNCSTVSLLNFIRRLIGGRDSLVGWF